MKNDYILDTVESFSKSLAKTLFEQKDDILPISIENLSDKDIIMVLLKKLVQQNKFNEAEDLLFDYAKKNNADYLIELGSWFYSELSKIDADILIKNNFSENEISSGLNDFNNLLKKHKKTI